MAGRSRSLVFLSFLMILFIFDCAGSLPLCLALLQRGLLLFAARGLSLPWLLSSCTGCRHVGSVVGLLWPYLLHSTWDLPRPRIEPMSPALEGRSLSTGPPGKSHKVSSEFSREGCIIFSQRETLEEVKPEYLVTKNAMYHTLQ